MKTLSESELRRPDSAGRINIGKENRDKLYAVQPQPNGDIVLSPVVARHEREAWLYESPAAMESVKRGLQQSAVGETRDLGSFAADVQEEEED